MSYYDGARLNRTPDDEVRERCRRLLVEVSFVYFNLICEM
jgi:hypothetical protein